MTTQQKYQKQLSSLSPFKERKLKISKSLFVSIFRKLHCQGCLARGKRTSSRKNFGNDSNQLMISDNRWDSSRSGTRCGKPHDNHRSGKIIYRFFSGNHFESSIKNYSGKVSYETNFSDEDSSNDSGELTGSDYKSSPNGVPSVKRDFQKNSDHFVWKPRPTHGSGKNQPCFFPMHRSRKNYFFEDFSDHMKFSVEDFEKDSGESINLHCELALSPNHAPRVKTEVQDIVDHLGSKPELTTWDVRNLTALRPLETQEVNGVESDGDLFFSCDESLPSPSPSPSHGTTPSSYLLFSMSLSDV
ncbi:hypothetical protein AMTR_s03205p00004670 [Amborella trichopoda]|uniref:Uncharacterized protein n=1 Tax=Amborella trichopoda TaxID=13333 RepID=U5CLF1_AMBTC|nr:hypothetical protein AMTR_s03205p00004670 [Amborella trichopoda]